MIYSFVLLAFYIMTGKRICQLICLINLIVVGIYIYIYKHFSYLLIKITLGNKIKKTNYDPHL